MALPGSLSKLVQEVVEGHEVRPNRGMRRRNLARDLVQSSLVEAPRIQVANDVAKSEKRPQLLASFWRYDRGSNRRKLETHVLKKLAMPFASVRRRASEDLRHADENRLHARVVVVQQQSERRWRTFLRARTERRNLRHRLIELVQFGANLRRQRDGVLRCYSGHKTIASDSIWRRR